MRARKHARPHAAPGVSDPSAPPTAQEQAWSLAPLIAGRPRVRVAHWDGRKKRWTYPTAGERDLTASVPPRPAAVLLYDHEGHCRTLVADVDVTGAEGAALTHRIVALFEKCGGRVVVDRSPAGKHHVYLPLRDGLAVEDAKRLAKALARRFPGVDPLPHSTGAISGCIRTPGSPYKDGQGHQQLVTDLNTARRALMIRNGSDVLGALERALSDEIAAVRREAITLARPVHELEAENPVEHTPLDGAVLSPRMLLIARDGLFEEAGYADRSRARQAVLTAARRAGLQLTDVIARVEDGRWAGLAAMYRNATTHWRTLLARTEWPKAVALVGATPGSQKTVRHCNTSEVPSHEGGHPGHSRNDFEEHRFIRRWRSALQDAERAEFPGKHGRVLRLVLRSLAAAAHKTASRETEFGVRSHALSLPVDHTQVSRALAELRTADDPWITLERDGRGTRGDLYRLRIPARHRERAAALPLAPAKVHALRPAFRVLGIEAAAVFEAVERGAQTVGAVATASGLARSTVYEHLGVLTAWNLVTRTDSGLLHAHPERLERAAEHLGADVLIVRLIAHYREQRRIWRAYLSRHSQQDDAGWWQALEREGPPLVA